MEFPKTQEIKKYVRDYYRTNIKNHVKTKRPVIYFPKGCSRQMARLVREYMEEDLNLEVTSLYKAPRTELRPVPNFKMHIKYKTENK